MQDPPSHREALLEATAEDLEAGDSPSCVPARSAHGALLKLRLLADGTCSMQQVEEQAPTSCPSVLTGLLHRDGGLPAQIPEADIVGATTSGPELVIWHAPVTSKPGAERLCRTVQRTHRLQLDSAAEAERVAGQLRAAACWAGRERPPRLLVIVNPASGPGKGPSIFEKQVKPVLEAAGCQLELRLTKAPLHATELVKQVAPGSYDAILAIGGDGTTHEVLQGMLGRPDWDAMRATPFAQIPCGSGNALAASVGLWTVDTAVHAAVKARHRQFDIASVLQQSPPRRCFSFLSINYGMITNLDIGTEHLRWMGGTRFVLGALHQILLKKKHTARVAILEPEAAARSTAAGSAAGGTTAAAAAAGGGAAGLQGSGQQHEGLAAAAAFDGPPVRHLAAFQQLAGQQLPPGWEWLPDPDVSLFTATNLPRLDMQFHLAPDALIDSGHFNLIYTPPASRMQGFAVMTASEKGEHMPLVKQRHAAAMALEPLSQGTWLVVDGEVVPYTHLFMEVHPSLCSAIVAPPTAGAVSNGSA